MSLRFLEQKRREHVLRFLECPTSVVFFLCLQRNISAKPLSVHVSGRNEDGHVVLSTTWRRTIANVDLFVRTTVGVGVRQTVCSVR